MLFGMLDLIFILLFGLFAVGGIVTGCKLVNMRNSILQFIINKDMSCLSLQAKKRLSFNDDLTLDVLLKTASDQVPKIKADATKIIIFGGVASLIVIFKIVAIYYRIIQAGR